MSEPAALAEAPAHVPEDVYASWAPSLSPDGTRVAFVSDRSGHPEVWLRALAGGPLLPVHLDGARVTGVAWSPDGSWLACSVAPPGGSRHEVWAVRPDGSGARLLAGTAPGTAVLADGRSHGWTADGSLVLTETLTTSQVLRVRPESGHRTVLYEAPLATAVDVTADGSRALVRQGPRGARELLLVGRDGGRPVLPASPHGSSESGCLTPDGGRVLARTDAFSETAQLVAGDLVVGRPGAELEEVALSGDGRVAALTWVEGGLSALTLLELATGRQTEAVPLPRLVVHSCRLSHDGSLLVLTAEGPSDPQGVWFGAPGAALVPLSSPGRGTLRASPDATVPGIEPAEVVAPVLHRLRSGDGTEITGWLYRPPLPGPLPTMLWLHGGPEAQERPVYSSLFQTLLSEGVAVFAPNVRGSTGSGRTFREADNGTCRPGAFADVAACAAHLVDSGVAQPGRLGVMGRSYGGYLTLAVLTRFPQLFQVGVAICGMSELPSWYRTTEPWIGAAAVTKYGDPVRDAALLTELSPLYALDRLRAPLLLVHGADDTNVPVDQSRQVATALSRLGAPHRLLVFDGEGHELLGTGSRVAFVHATLQWVLEHL